MARYAGSMQLLWCAVGIIGSLLVYSLLQERLMGARFGDEQFRYSLLLVLVNRLVSLTVAIASAKSKNGAIRPEAPLWTYAAVSASNVAATTCQYEALKHVTLPVQTLGKSTKMLPVMIWGTVLLGKRYGLRAYADAVVVAAGGWLFLSSGDVTSVFASDSFKAMLYGAVLMTAYLFFDGFTSTFQAKLFKGYSTSVNNQMIFTTLSSVVLALIGLVSTSQVQQGFGFLQRHPEAMLYMILLSLAATTGQACILQTIKAFGPLVLAMIMMSRQFLSILLSCLVYQHALTARQWLGISLVFAAIADNTLAKKRQSASKAHPG